MGPARAAIDRAGRELADAVFPRRCFLCGRHAEDGLACRDHVLPAAPPGPRCGTCAGPLPPAVPDGARCADCRTRSPGFRSLVALCDYRAQPVGRAWLLALKYGGRREVALPLGLALGTAWLRRAPARWRGDAVLVPVPLHWSRRLERGFDQARALAVHAARTAGLPWAAALRRRVATAVQGAPGSASRSANVRDAFRARRRARGDGRVVRLEGRCVWLVDDVVTSGATVTECARELRRAGAAAVCVLAVARAGPGAPGDSGESGPAGPARTAAGGWGTLAG